MDIRTKSGKEAFAASHAAVLTGVQQYAVLIDLFGLRSDGATAVVYANAIQGIRNTIPRESTEPFPR